MVKPNKTKSKCWDTFRDVTDDGSKLLLGIFALFSLLYLHYLLVQEACWQQSYSLTNENLLNHADKCGSCVKTGNRQSSLTVFVTRSKSVFDVHQSESLQCIVKLQFLGRTTYKLANQSSTTPPSHARKCRCIGEMNISAPGSQQMFKTAECKKERLKEASKGSFHLKSRWFNYFGFIILSDRLHYSHIQILVTSYEQLWERWLCAGENQRPTCCQKSLNCQSQDKYTAALSTIEYDFPSF